MLKKITLLSPAHYLRMFGVCFTVAIADQITKALITARFAFGESLPIIEGFFNLVLVYNKGAAFGMMGGVSEGLRQIVLGFTTLIALGTVLYLLFSEYALLLRARLAIGLILGGAIGNIIDRVRLGHVVDFLDFYIGSYHWPAFNVADSAICIGVGLLLITNVPEKAAVSEVSTQESH